MALYPPRLATLAHAPHAIAEDYSAMLSRYKTPAAVGEVAARALARVASNAACVRLATFSRFMICFTCAFTVLSDILSAPAINLLDLPSDISARTSR
jgi:hypothetical protein